MAPSNFLYKINYAVMLFMALLATYKFVQAYNMISVGVGMILAIIILFSLQSAVLIAKTLQIEKALEALELKLSKKV